MFGYSSDCNSSPRRRCKDPNSAKTDCHHVMAAAVEVLEAAKGFDLAGVAEAGHMSTAAADETVCKKPWADVQQAKTIE